MDRRGFVRLALAGVGVGIIAPRTVLAGVNEAAMAGGLYYTKDAPGRWSKKVGGHLPNIEIERPGGKVRLQVVTSHEMKGFEHYIIKHMVLDADFRFVTENMFDPMTQKAPISTFDLGAYSGPVHVLSVCNKHDTWLNTAEV